MHIAVLLNEALEVLSPKPGDVFVDATFGGGTHSKAILEKISPDGKLIAIDRDPDAVERGQKLFDKEVKNVTFVNNDFRNLKSIIKSCTLSKINGVIFDLGVSSFQIDDSEKGFSFLKEGPLDMRFDRSRGASAKDAVNKFSRDELADIIREYGEERYARKVADYICDFRRKKKIETTEELASIVQRAVGARYRSQRLHPACRTFQALRIYVNDELGALKEGMASAVDLLEAGGRICVISFHSLEDRIVKKYFKEEALNGRLRIITKKPVCPSDEEIRSNPRARSAKMRAAEKI